MTHTNAPLALIAEDEPVLARTLSRLLAEVWPGLRLTEVAEDGLSATTQALAQLPDILFLEHPDARPHRPRRGRGRQ